MFKSYIYKRPCTWKKVNLHVADKVMGSDPTQLGSAILRLDYNLISSTQIIHLQTIPRLIQTPFQQM